MVKGIFEIFSHFLILQKQCFRVMLCLGIVRIVIVTLLFSYLCYGIYLALGINKNVLYISILWVVIVMSVHLNRSDWRFVYINMDYHQLIYGVENIMLSIPVVLFMSLQKKWLYAVGVIVLSFIFGFFQKKNFRFRYQTLNTYVQRNISCYAFEWRAGTRKFMLSICLLFLIGLVGAPYLIISCISLAFMGLLIFGFYKQNESWQMLISCGKNSRSFLLLKLKQHFSLLILLFSPIILIQIIFHPEMWYVSLCEFLILLFIHFYGILLKYAYFSHTRNTVSPVFRIVGLIIGLNPITTILLLPALIYLYNKANSNLTFYLNDFN